MDVVTNGRSCLARIARRRQGQGRSHADLRHTCKPGEEKPTRKIGYAVAVPGFNMYLGTGAYLDDIDAKLKPIVWLLGLAILGIAVISGSIAWLIGRSISGPLGQLGARMKALADGKLEGEIPGVGRGDEVGAMAATVQIFKDNAVRMRELEKSRPRPRRAPPPSAARRWKASPATSSAASTASSVRCRRRRPACRPPRSR